MTDCPIYSKGHSQFQRWNGPNQKLRKNGLNFVGFITVKAIPACISIGQSNQDHQQFKMPYKDFNLSMLQATSVTSEYFIIVHSRQLQFSSKHILIGYEGVNNFTSFQNVHNHKLETEKAGLLPTTRLTLHKNSFGQKPSMAGNTYFYWML